MPSPTLFPDRWLMVWVMCTNNPASPGVYHDRIDGAVMPGDAFAVFVGKPWPVLTGH